MANEKLSNVRQGYNPEPLAEAVLQKGLNPAPLSQAVQQLTQESNPTPTSASPSSSQPANTGNESNPE